MPLTRRLTAVAALVATGVVGSSEARAATPQELYDEAWAAMDKKDYEAACELFEESYEASRATGPLQGLAACYEARGFLLQARAMWLSAIEVLPPGSASAIEANAAAQRLTRRLPSVSVRLAPGTPASSRIELDGVVVTDSAARPVDPVLEHVIRVTAPGHEPSEVRVRLAERERRDVVVAPGPEARGAAAIGPVRGSGIALLTLGGIGLTAAAVTGGMMIGESRIVDAGCPGEGRVGCDAAALDAAERAQALSPWNIASWVVGIAATGAGIPMVIVGDDAAASGPRTELGVGPGSITVELVF